MDKYANEYISKRDAINAVINYTDPNYEIDEKSLSPFASKEEVIAAVIKKLPYEPKIIHCRDCRFWQDQEEGIVEVPICARPENKYDKFPLVMLIDGDGFCSYAERKENENR